MRHNILTFAAVHQADQSAWAFVIRETLGRIKGRFVHSASGTGTVGRVAAGFYGLGFGLTWLLEQYRTKEPLLILRSRDEVGVLLTIPVTSLDARIAALQSRCIELLDCFPEWSTKEIPLEDCQADQMARQAWESATLKLFPNRPTGRRLLPGQTRATA